MNATSQDEMYVWVQPILSNWEGRLVSGGNIYFIYCHPDAAVQLQNAELILLEQVIIKFDFCQIK